MTKCFYFKAIHCPFIVNGKKTKECDNCHFIDPKNKWIMVREQGESSLSKSLEGYPEWHTLEIGQGFLFRHADSKRVRITSLVKEIRNVLKDMILIETENSTYSIKRI